LIVALDVTALTPALRMARQLRGVVRTVKIGSALFTACGPDAIRHLRTLGFEIMLDLKFHDIPSTVAKSCRAAVAHRVSLMTLHAAGGAEMLSAAVEGVRAEAKRLRVPRPRLLAVTVLTSVPARRASSMTRRVVELAKIARRSGCDGIVASAHEVRAIRRTLGRSLSIVCPGIRPAGEQAGDQSRICTPAEALARGADALVVGRPITAARNPRAAAQQILSDMESSGRC
jgi:orotidine-5'-phosphate decarboxylase